MPNEYTRSAYDPIGGDGSQPLTVYDDATKKRRRRDAAEGDGVRGMDDAVQCDESRTNFFRAVS